eukprot:tig00021622_g22993.t1
MAVTPFHYRMSAALLMHWSGRRPEVIPKTLRAQARSGSTRKPSAARLARPAARVLLPVPADRARGGRAREGTHRDRRVMHGNRVTVTASTAPAASDADDFAGLDDAAFAAVAREHGLELEDAPAPAPTRRRRAPAS